jgi:acetyltransferase-like isoleucine patch superfamily enzyme
LPPEIPESYWKSCRRFRFAVWMDTMPGRLMRLWNRPLSRKIQFCSFIWAKLKTQYVYKWVLRSCGGGSIVCSPLFWTPEFIAIGRNVLIWRGCRIEGVDSDARSNVFLPHISIGDGVTIQQNCHITAGGSLTIEAGATILYDAMITDVDHGYEEFGTRIVDQPIKVISTRVGRNCFIGSGAKILAGTTLGEGCVVGANSVVRGNYSAGSVIAGVPGRVVKHYDARLGAWIKTDSA